MPFTTARSSEELDPLPETQEALQRHADVELEPQFQHKNDPADLGSSQFSVSEFEAEVKARNEVAMNLLTEGELVKAILKFCSIEDSLNSMLRNEP